ncbi:putative glycoside hydrolase 131, catalytic [Plasmopara halstedii]
MPENRYAASLDGRGEGLDVKTITKKYLTHILTMRNDSKLTVEDYISIEQKAREPAYNGDSAVISISVDGKAQFKDQHDFRRTELVQFVASNPKGVTFFPCFDELHVIELRVDASVTPAKLIFLCGGTWDPKWETTFKPGTWYNFGIAVSAGETPQSVKIEFYESEGNEELVLKTKETAEKPYPSDFEFHIGLLTLSDDKSAPKMNKDPDTLMFNGVSVTPEISTATSLNVNFQQN